MIATLTSTSTNPLPEWVLFDQPAAYEQTITAMEDSVAAIYNRTAQEQIWLLEHPPLYTAGTSAKTSELLENRFPVYPTGRGGAYTYHGPGQRVGYVMLRLSRYNNDIRRYIWLLEEWLIQTLAVFDVKGERREGRVGIWVSRGGHEAKIAAIGVRVRRGITYHGVALNVKPDLQHFTGIVPCGLSGFGVTSLADQGVDVAMPDVDKALQRCAAAVLL